MQDNNATLAVLKGALYASVDIIEWLLIRL